MRIVHATFGAVALALATALALAGERESVVRSAMPKLPKTTVLAATLLRGDTLIPGDKWYALSSGQITSLCKALAKPPFSLPPDVEEAQLPPLGHTIILWVTEDRTLVPADVVKCDDNMYYLESTKTGRLYELAGSAEREELLKLMRRIREGSEQPIGQAGEGEATSTPQGVRLIYEADPQDGARQV